MYRKITQPGPLKAMAAGVINSNEMVAFPMQGVDSAMTCHFQVTAFPGNYTLPILEKKQDIYDIYGDSGSPNWMPIDLNANLDVKRYAILPTDGLTPGNTYGFRVRYRDNNIEWGKWSEEKTFVYSTTAPTATCDFVADSLNVPAGYIVSFADLSGANATSWQWDFDNDAVIDSYVQDPFHQYNTAGYYTVSLIINGGGAGNNITKNAYIHVYGSVGVNSTIDNQQSTISIYPNPFTTTTTISFNLNKEQTVNAEIMDNSGKVVKQLQTGKLAKGARTLVWDGKSDAGEKLATGNYIINIKGETFSSSKKIILERK